MDSSDIAVLSVGGSIAFYPHVESVEDVAEQADVGEGFTNRAEIVGTLDEYSEDVAAEMEDWDTSDGVMHWTAPYDN